MVKIGMYDLSHVEVLNGLDNEDTVLPLQAKAYLIIKRFKERVQLRLVLDNVI